MTFWATCEGCGQLTPADDAWTVRGIGQCCRARLYGADQEHAAIRMFDTPAQLPGQAEMFDPDDNV